MLYTGVADDPIKRWVQHASGKGAKFIRANGFLKPVFLESFKDKSAAMRKEREIKCLSRDEKLKMIFEGRNLLDLFGLRQP